MANRFIEQQCINMVQSIEIFETACKMAAMKDDGKVSKEEEKVLQKIAKAGLKYKSELLKITK